MNSAHLNELINRAIKEDIGEGDHSTLSCIPPEAKGIAKLVMKDAGIIAGVSVAQETIKQIDSLLQIETYTKDGTRVNHGDIVFTLTGKVHSILKTERLLLNIMQRMSGIATLTAQYVDKVKGLNSKILDTRKTTPGFRYLEKMAVKIGGGENHRMGLFDMIMLKDNHIDFAGGIIQAIQKADQYRKKINSDLKIEIETRNLEEIEKVLSVGNVNRIMLDNFSINETKKAVDLINGRFETESSGGITLETVRRYAECGVDFISVGALTHQISSLDMSLTADYQKNQ